MTIVYLPLSFTAVSSTSFFRFIILSSSLSPETLGFEPIPIGPPSPKDSFHYYNRSCGTVDLFRIWTFDMVC
jgi:hypothetical protein